MASIEWSTTHIDSQVPGEPGFSISYPSIFGQPLVTASISARDRIAAEENLGHVVFYVPESPRTYPSPESNIFLAVHFAAIEIKPGQTLDGVASEPFDKAAQALLVKHKLTSNGRAVIAQKHKMNPALARYYVELDKKTVVEFLFGTPQPQGTQEESAILSAMEDKIIESIKFLE
jgi:hypothetical protein